MTQHVEFFDKEHFECHYHRQKAGSQLSRFIDYFWETDFDALFRQYPQGFSDALFPNIGYTYLVNLGTPFVMQLNQEQFHIKNDAFLPRHCSLICHHSPGNKIFGIKFKVSPVVFQKKVNFSEYKEYIFSLSYLIEQAVIDKLKQANDFNQRVHIISAYYKKILDQYTGSLQYVDVVTRILENYSCQGNFKMSIEELAKSFEVSTRTLQRYFEKATSTSSKHALQVLRIRKAIEHLVADPGSFSFSLYSYYDYSHFYKHLRQFLGQHSVDIAEPHLKLLNNKLNQSS